LVAYERVEVITSVERRRRWSAQEKLRLVAESYRAEGGGSCPGWWCSSAVAMPLASAPMARWRAGGIAAVIDGAGRIGLRDQPDRETIDASGIDPVPQGRRQEAAEGE
jgi:hypothetical protein